MWIFAYEYYTSAIGIPYIFEQKETPKLLIDRNTVLFWSVLVVNLISPVLYASELGYGNMYSFHHNG